MQNNQLSFFKMCLFLAGLLLSFLIGMWIPGIYQVEIVWRRGLTCTTVILLYLAGTLPFLMMEIRSLKDADPLFLAGAVYFRGFVAYALVSIVRIFLIQWMMIGFTSAVVSELTALFVFAVYAYLACFTGDHTESVAKYERAKTADLDEIREELQMLEAKASLLGEEQKEICERIGKLKENVRYLSPSDRETAESLEREMLARIAEISSDPIFQENGSDCKDRVLQKLSDLDRLYRQRKSIL